MNCSITAILTCPKLLENLISCVTYNTQEYSIETVAVFYIPDPCISVLPCNPHRINLI